MGAVLVALHRRFGGAGIASLPSPSSSAPNHAATTTGRTTDVQTKAPAEIQSSDHAHDGVADVRPTAETSFARVNRASRNRVVTRRASIGEITMSTSSDLDPIAL